MTATSSTVLEKRRMLSAYSSFIGRRLRSFGEPPSPGPPLAFETKILSGPSSLKNVTTPARSPVSSDATVTTVVIPMMMPRTVRPDRNLWDQTASIAMAMFSRGEIYMLFRSPLLRSQSDDRVKLRRLRRRIPAADDSDRARDKDRQNHVSRRDPQRHPEGRGQDFGHYRAETHADSPTRERHDDRLDENLHHDVGAPRAQRLPDADLTSPLGHADQHDVHDDDATDHQGNTGDRHHHGGYQFEQVVDERADGVGRDEVKLVFLSRTLVKPVA